MRAFDQRFGWGTVVEENSFHVVVQFDCEPEYSREYVKLNGEDDQLRR